MFNAFMRNYAHQSILSTHFFKVNSSNIRGDCCTTLWTSQFLCTVFNSRYIYRIHLNSRITAYNNKYRQPINKNRVAIYQLAAPVNCVIVFNIGDNQMTLNLDKNFLPSLYLLLKELKKLTTPSFTLRVMLSLCGADCDWW